MPTYASISVPLARVEPGDWDWTALGTIATALAALVTAITIIFVAKQTSATTKAAQEAQRSADAAHRALDHSQKQLEYSHQQHQQSLYMAVETVKARIDADMPRLITEDVTVLPEIFMEDGSRLLPAFSDPGDRNRRIAHRIRFTIRNDGPRTAKLYFSHPMKYHKNLVGGSEGIQLNSTVKDSIPVGVGEALVGELEITSDAGYWMNVSEIRASGKQPDSYPQFSIRYLTDADTGAHENHTFVLAGEALKRDPHQLGLWHHISPDVMNGEGSEFGAFAEPVRRLYFVSRVRNEPLPDLPWDRIEKVPATTSAAPGTS